MLLTRSLSEYERQRLCMILLGLNVIQIFVSITGFFLGAYVSLSVNSKAHLVKGYSLKPIGATLSGCSIAMFLLHCFGAKVGNDCCYLRTRHRFENKLFLIVFGCTVMSIVLLIVSVFCLVENLKLKRALRHGLLSTMRLYAKDKKIKRNVDELQMEYRCCGNTNYTDWFKVKWMSEYFLPSETDRTFNRKDHLQSVPFSCCDPTHSGPCILHPVNTDRGESQYSEHGFFKIGCIDVILEVLQEITQTIAILVLAPLFLELTIAVQTRYLQTSFADCKMWGQPCGVGNCWLFRRQSYEPILQPMADSRDYFTDCSEESIPCEPKGTKAGEDHISRQSLKEQNRLILGKDRHENENGELRRLLLNQLESNKRESRSESGENSRRGCRENYKPRNGNRRSKLVRNGSGSGTKASKDKDERGHLKFQTLEESRK